MTLIPQQGNNPLHEWIMMWDMKQPSKSAPMQPMKKVATQISAPAADMYTPSNNGHKATVVDNAEDGGLDEAPGIELNTQPPRRNPSWTR